MSSPARPLVSIVTPTFNQAEYLAEAIASILAQDYPHIEYLVLDDGSTDDTPSVLGQFDGKVRWERHENMGQARTLNKGWRLSSGKYLAYLSADDRLAPTAISTLVEAIERHSAAPVVYGDFNLIDKNGAFVSAAKSPDFDHAQLVEELNCQPGVGALFRRTIFDELGGWNPSLYKIPDFEFWLRAARRGAFHHVPVTVGDYRVHEDSTAIRPLPYEKTMEIVRTMQAYWDGDAGSPQARRSLGKAHFVAAKNHAQSGRPLAAAGQFLKACSLRPRLAIQRSAWRGLVSGFMIYHDSRSGGITGHRR